MPRSRSSKEPPANGLLFGGEVRFICTLVVAAVLRFPELQKLYPTAIFPTSPLPMSKGIAHAAKHTYLI